MLLPIVIALALAVAFLFGSLQVSVTPDALVWRFGIGLIKGRIALDRIAAVQITRTARASGSGIRRLPDGWLDSVAAGIPSNYRKGRARSF